MFLQTTRNACNQGYEAHEQLSIDLKGSIENLNRNNCMLTAIDEYSGFPFAFPCFDINAETVIKCLAQLFLLFCQYSCIHSNRTVVLNLFAVKYP